MLYEEGKFQLTDPLSKYFPAVAEMKVYAGTSAQGQPLLDAQKRPITLQHVFSHSAGFSYGFGSTPVDRQYQDANLFATNLDDMMAKLVQLPLAYQPGERWQYSVAHDVQAALVEKLSGQKFDDFVRQRIFAPLGMVNSYFQIPAAQRARIPALYGPGANGKFTPDTSPLGRNYGDLVFGGYSISATAHDYVRFAQMLLNKGKLDGERLLSPKTVELMASNHLSDQAMTTVNTPPVILGQGAGYGLGVSVLLDPAKHGNLGSAGEFGWSGAASTHVLIDPKEDLVAVYCTQLMGDYALRSEFVTLLYQSIIGN
jgi:CubicO group peptidase (beta-lactamase class C family)